MLIPSGYGHVVCPITHAGMGRSAVVTWGFQNVGALIGPVIAADACIEALEPDINAVLDTEVTIGPVQVKMNIGGTELVGESTTTLVGASPDNRPPAQVALLVQKRTGLAGRRNRGRFYWPWAVAEASVDELGRITPSTVVDFQNAFDNFLEALETEGVPMRVLHNTAGTPADVIQLRVSNVVGTQRRRLDR